VKKRRRERGEEEKEVKKRRREGEKERRREGEKKRKRRWSRLPVSFTASLRSFTSPLPSGTDRFFVATSVA
jgi:hypothetical protein